MPIYIALVLPSISAHCTLAQHHGEYYPYSPSRQSGKPTPWCHSSQYHLFAKKELTACNAVWTLSSELSTASQSSTRAHAKRMAATRYHMFYGSHWLPPSSGASGSSTSRVSCWLFFCGSSGSSASWVSCQLHQLYCWSCSWRQLSHCIWLCT